MMKRLTRFFLLLAGLMLPLIVGASVAMAALPPGTAGYLVTNDDFGRGSTDTATFFSAAADGTLSNPTLVTVGGQGAGGGFFANNRVIVQSSPTSPCVYVAQGSSATVAGVQALTQTVVGRYPASATDSGVDNGAGMAMNNNYLFANFSTSGTIATFTVQSGCVLQFLSDITPVGLNGGVAKGMAVHGNLLVVSYGDGSIESFNISNGTPVSNGDAQLSAGSAIDDSPDGVVITADGHYAIFGDDSSDAAVEVSDISSGKLTQTVLYQLPSGLNSNNVILSPDGTLIYVVNNTSGQVTAAFFNGATGVVSGSCISPELNGFDSSFSFLSTPATLMPTGTGSVLYIAEFGSSIAEIDVSAGNGQCTLTEAAESPVLAPNSQNLLSIAVVQTAQPGLYSPVPGSTLTGNTATFQWNGSPSATAVWIDVGSSAGGNQFYQSGSLPASTLSATVNDLPTNGSTVYVTLYFFIGGSWMPNAYTFTAFSTTSGAGVLTTPVPGSSLSGSSVTFGWTAGSNATSYWIDIGSTVGGNQYYQSGNLGNVLSKAVTGLPTNGTTVYVTLYSLIGGAWISNRYTYTAYNAASAGGVMNTPTPGSKLTGSTVTFNWTPGAGTAWWLDLGSTPGGNQYSQSGSLNVQTETINSLPTDGSMVYATLYTLIGGAWSSNAYTYTASNGTAGLAAMTSPTPGTTLHGNSATFTWSADASATAYWLDIGSVAGGNQYYQSGNLGTALTTSVNSLPANSSTIYVTLYSLVGGQWSNNAYTYTSAP